MKNSDKIILDLCGGTGSWSRPYKEAGYDVRLITLPDYSVTEVVFCDSYMVFKKQTSNVNDMVIEYARVYGILAAPPCTEFSILNCRAESRIRNPEVGLVTVEACTSIIDKCNSVFWALENPVGHLRKYLDKPRYTFQPWWFGDGWTKRTDIWGCFNIPERTYQNWEDVPMLAIYIRPNRQKPSIAYLHKSAQKYIPQIIGYQIETDADLRAITPPGFARAFFKENQ